MTEPAGSIQFMRRVLIVEDDFALADLLHEVLIHENCESDTASNGMEALDKLRGADYDAVICDLMMPRVDGQAFYEQVERSYPFLADKFLFITGQASRMSGLGDFITRTGNTLLEKPFEVEEFRAALRELLAR